MTGPFPNLETDPSEEADCCLPPSKTRDRSAATDQTRELPSVPSHHPTHPSVKLKEQVMARCRPVFSAVLGTVAGILILASGCADQDPTAVQLKPAKALSAARAYSGGTFATSIGPLGGILKLPVGRIVFPAGAVDAETHITATLDGRDLAVIFGPHGLQFPEGHEPSIEFELGSLSIDPSRLRIVYLDAADRLLETLVTQSDGQNVTAELRHFSKYALSEAEPRR
jgi:hypothetical protein